VGVYTKSKTSELSPLRRKLLRFAKQFPPPLRSNKRCNHRSDGIFQILSRNLLAVSSDAAQLIFTPSSALPELASCFLNNTKIRLHFLVFVMKIWCKFVQIGCIFRGCSGCLPEGVLILYCQQIRGNLEQLTSEQELFLHLAQRYQNCLRVF
jgi:hypothetical protein